MKIVPINNTNKNTNFSARIALNPEWNNYLQYINKYAPYKEGVFNTAKQKELIEKFVNAIEANPSDALISIDIFYRKNECFNARGVISSQYGKFTDTEPARSDSEVPCENIIRRILNPENRLQMCKLFGAHKNAYDIVKQNEWWDKHIEPMWKDIQELFYEKTLYERSEDRRFNKVFRELNPVFEDDD